MGSKWYAELEEPHSRLHQAGTKLLESARRGVSKKELMLNMRQLTELSILIISMLQKIGNEAFPITADTDLEQIYLE